MSLFRRSFRRFSFTARIDERKIGIGHLGRRGRWRVQGHGGLQWILWAKKGWGTGTAYQMGLQGLEVGRVDQGWTEGWRQVSSVGSTGGGTSAIEKVQSGGWISNESTQVHLWIGWGRNGSFTTGASWSCKINSSFTTKSLKLDMMEHRISFLELLFDLERHSVEKSLPKSHILKTRWG